MSRESGAATGLENFWPDVSTVESASKSVRTATGLAFLVAGVNALLALLTWADVIRILPTWSLVDGTAFGILGLFIHRRSRVAAVLCLALYLGEIAHKAATGVMGTTAAAVPFFLALYFVHGVRATFSIAKLERAGDRPGS